MKMNKTAIYYQIMQVAKEIIPVDHFKVLSFKKIADETYLIKVEDKQYLYHVEVKLLPHGEDCHYRLLLFDYTQKT